MMATGEGAQHLATRLKQYLKEPNKRFRRVRNKQGKLVLSKTAKAYSPGKGIYRSSYKNARRLAVTEGNMAFHTADHNRWQQLDFVVGFKVIRSNTECDCKVCEMLAGNYPKEFLFTGWHPHCRCSAIAILKTPEEIKQSINDIRNGKKPSTQSRNQVTELPQGFIQWQSTYQHKITSSLATNTAPFFVRDNAQLILAKPITTIIGKKEKLPESPFAKVRSDPMGIGSIVDFVAYRKDNRSLKQREKAFRKVLQSEIHHTDRNGAIVMVGAKPTETELHTAGKLVRAKNGYNTIFISQHQVEGIKKILGIKNKTNADILLVDKKTFVSRLADIKTVGNASRETIKAHIMKGSEQAPVVVLDIQGQVKRFDLIKGIRDGWCKNTKSVILNYKGQWYEISKREVFRGKWLENNIR